MRRSRISWHCAQCAVRAALGLALALCLAVGSALAQLDDARVREVASMVTERPAGLGQPIADRPAWERLAAHPAWQDVVPRAERLLTEPLPETTDELYLDYSRTGNRTRWEDVAWRRRSRVKDFALAECLEDRGRFLSALEQTVRALCAERTWVMPASDDRLANFRGDAADIELASSALAWELATADCLLADRLSPDLRGLIRDNVRRRILAPYSDMVAGRRRPNWWLKTTNNWNAVCLAGVTGAALALVDSRQERAGFVVAAELHIRSFLRGFTPDGYCSEGVSYWNYGFGHYVLLGETVRQTTGGGVDLFALPEARAPAVFGARIEIVGAVYPAFADCPVGTRPDARLMHFLSRLYGPAPGPRDQADLVSPSGSLPQALMYSFPNSASAARPAAAGTGAGLRSWFEQGGVLICRPAAGTAGTFGVALKGGHNDEHHNHNDVGSFVVVSDGQDVLLDPGGEVYTARTFSSRRYESNVLNSYGHAVPVVAGTLQRTGRDARAQVIRAEFEEAADTLELDLSSAYDVPALRSLRRTFVYRRAGAGTPDTPGQERDSLRRGALNTPGQQADSLRRGALTVTDEVAFESPQRFGTALITLGRWERLGPNSLRVYDTEGAVRVDVEAAGAGFTVKAEEIKEDVRARGAPLRIGIELERPVTSGSIRLTITPLSGLDLPLLPNGGFEEGAWGWRMPADGMGSVETGRAAGGKASLRVRDTSDTEGSSIDSARIRVAESGVFELRGQVLPVSGEGLGLYVHCLAEDGRVLNEMDERGWTAPVVALGGSEGTWRPFSARFTAPPGTRHLRIWIHSFNASRVEAYLDNLEITPLTGAEDAAK